MSNIYPKKILLLLTCKENIIFSLLPAISRNEYFLCLGLLNLQVERFSQEQTSEKSLPRLQQITNLYV